jgi:hypothetical protein
MNSAARRSWWQRRRRVMAVTAEQVLIGGFGSSWRSL